MASNQASPAPENPSPDDQPELFAASASERTIRAAKEVTNPSDEPPVPNTSQHKVLTADTDESRRNSSTPDSKIPPDSSAPRDLNSRTNDVSDEATTKLLSQTNMDKMTKEELIESALNCPCISDMKEGTCGSLFIDAYRCFLISDTEPKGMDCMEQFKGMQSCLAANPQEYNLDDDIDNADLFKSKPNEKSEPNPLPKDPKTFNS